MATGTRKPGEFCWINVMTPQPAQAREFFAQLLGWTCVDMPGLGYAIKVGGRDIGGLFDVVSPRTPNGMPPVIGVMVKVESADATCARIAQLGGRAQPPFGIMEQGRMSVCFDPNGAEFDIWEPKRLAGTDVDSSLHGAPSWFEALTTDVERATDFYSSLFGWTPETMPMPSGAYTTFKQGGEYVAGMMSITQEMGSVRPHWGTYFTATNVDETAREATRLGGTLFVPPQDVSGVGRFCGIASPQGVMFYVITYAR